MANHLQTIQNVVATATASGIRSTTPVSGGCINDTFAIDLSNGERVFAKINQNAPVGFFEAEAEALRSIQSAGCIRVPQVIQTGTESGLSYLLLEFIQTGASPRNYFEKLGSQLAELHRTNTNPQFGFHRDNFIGSTPQPNPTTTNWVEFWGVNRIGFQVELAEQNGLIDRQVCGLAERFVNNLERWIDLPKEPPCLVHGDLWSGNLMCDDHGRPVLVDPASYYAHREVEFGMTTLFGGFEEAFYDAYREAWPLENGFEQRIEIYRLYHLMNHLNLFGSSYRSGCLEILRKYQ